MLGAFLSAGLDFELKQQQVSKQNLSATKFEAIDLEKKVYRHLKDLNRIIEESDFDKKLKAQAKAIFLKIAEAEAKIHNQPIEKVHFHEISAIDTIIDVIGALVGLKLLNIKEFY